MIIPRATYLNKLIAHKHNPLIKITYGAKRIPDEQKES